MTDKPSTLHSAINDLQKAVERTVAYFEQLDVTNVPVLLEAFRTIHENAELLDALNTIISGIKRKTSYETIPSVFESMGIDSIKSKGRNFIVGTRLNASIPLDKRELGFKWLRENGYESLIAPTVNPKSLSSAVAQYIESTAKEPPEEAMTVYKQTYTQIRKA